LVLADTLDGHEGVTDGEHEIDGSVLIVSVSDRTAGAAK